MNIFTCISSPKDENNCDSSLKITHISINIFNKYTYIFACLCLCNKPWAGWKFIITINFLWHICFIFYFYKILSLIHEIDHRIIHLNVCNSLIKYKFEVTNKISKFIKRIISRFDSISYILQL